MIFVTQMMQGFTLNNYFLKNFHLFFSSYFSHFLTCGKDGHIHIYKTTSDEVYDIDCSCPCYRLVAQVRSFKDIFFSNIIFYIFRMVVIMLEQGKTRFNFVHFHKMLHLEVFIVLIDHHQLCFYLIYIYLLEIGTNIF